MLLQLFFLVYQLEHQRWLLNDSDEYLYAAENLLTHGLSYSAEWEQPLRADHLTKRPPVYPLVVGLVEQVAGSLMWLIFVQSCLSLFNIYLLSSMLRELNLWDRAGNWLWVLVLLYPAQFIYANLVMTEMLFQTLLLGACFLAMRALATRSMRYAWGYSLLLLLAVFTKPVMYLFVIPNAIMLLGMAARWKRNQLLVMALLPLLVVGAYALWNQQRTGYFHVSSIQSKSLLQYTTYHLLLQEEGPEMARNLTDEIQRVANQQESFAQSERYVLAACKDIILERPAAYAWLHARGMLNFFLDPGRFDLYHFFGWQTSDEPGLLHRFGEAGYVGIWDYLRQQPVGILLLLGLVTLGNGIKLLALLAFPFVRGMNGKYKFLILLLVLYLATLTGINGASRFAMPIFPLLLVAVAAVGHWLLPGRKRNA